MLVALEDWREKGETVVVKHMDSTWKRRISMMLGVAVAAGAIWTGAALFSNDSRSSTIEPALASGAVKRLSASSDSNPKGLLRYESYQKKVGNPSAIASQPIQLLASELDHSLSEGSPIESSYEGSTGQVIRSGEMGTFGWTFHVEEEGWYDVKLRYFPESGTGSPIERELRVDGNIPFAEAERMLYPRIWGNEREDIERDSNDNDIRPRQVEQPGWTERSLNDAEGYYADTLAIYLAKGAHSLQFIGIREPMMVERVTLEPRVAKSYSDIEKEYAEKGYQQADDALIKVQGESASHKSSPSLYPINDRSGPDVEPYDASRIRMNAIGGDHWKAPGQWIAWNVEVPTDGLYEIGFKYKQDLARGLKVTRKLMVDGELPFAEAAKITFPPSTSWDVKAAADERTGKPYLFYLTKGKHELRLEVTMGDLADMVRIVKDSIQELNGLYRKIIMITGTAPDQFRDYPLEDLIPTMADTFLAQSKQLSLVADEMDRLAGGASVNATVLRTTSYRLQDLGEHPDTITSRLTSFKDGIMSLGTWMLSVNTQPLTLDYLFVSSPKAALPEAGAGLWASVKHELSSFWYSFTDDYNLGGGGKKTDITVWVAGGRDQAQLIRTLIDSYFTPDTGIQVDLQLVGENVLLPATLAGKGPDVAIATGNVVDFAMRNALEDLSQYPNFQEVYGRFHDSAFASFKFKDGVFAIPETQLFPMLFYRKDVLSELGMKVPDTWEEMMSLVPELQKRNMQIGLMPNPTFDTLLYQLGGSYYEGDGIATAIGKPEGMEAFRHWTELYTHYKLPREFEFVNRFRTGEIPLGIADYTTFNTLAVFAPEIRGEWGFAPIPGVKGTDDVVHRESLSSATGSVMFKKAKNKEAAWKFMSWWTNADTQSSFGREMESILGESGRYTAANVEALKRLPWSAKEVATLNEQWKWIVGKPAVPGSYSFDRHLQNAFFEVFNNGTDVRETLEEYIRIINQELTIKRKEFNLPIREGEQ